jgi:ATP-binding cassette subfamily F protein 3
MDDYRAWLSDRARPAARPDSAPSRNGERRDRAEARAAQAPIRARLKAVETQLEKLGLEAKLIERRLEDPDTYAKRKPEDIAWATTRRAAIAREVERLEAEWLELSEQLEAA